MRMQMSNVGVTPLQVIAEVDRGGCEKGLEVIYAFEKK